MVGGIVMIAFQVVGFFGRNYFWVEQQFTWDIYIIRKYLRKFITLDQWTLESMGTGKIYNIFDKWTSESTLLLLSFLAQFVRVICTLGFAVILVRWLPWYLVVGGLLIITMIFVVIVYMNKFTTFYRRQRKENNIKIGGAFAKIIMSKFEILQNNRIEEEIDKINVINDTSWMIARKQNLWGSFLFQWPKFLLSCIIVGSYYYLGTRVLWGTYALGEMVGLLTVFALFEITLRDGIEYYENFTKTFIHVEKLWEFVDSTPQIIWYSTGQKFTFKKWDYIINNVSFSYGHADSVIKNFSATIQGWKKTALVGKSWGGKTTLMKLLAGYMRPSKWSLTIDKQDITDIRLDSYYPHIGYLTQEPSVFDGTIRENLLYGAKGKISRERITKAIELAECHFIYELEHGLDTEIGERWIRLSGGQKQRLAIAKIFLKDPEIILLDEPTAALDSYSEKKVAQAFEHLFEGRTDIVIEADDIIVIEKGKIVERGTHNELIKLGWNYSGMVDLQSGVVREEGNEEIYEK